MIGLIGTMPYVYPTLPDIDTMALFNSISLPYSFKFLIGILPSTQRPSYKNTPASTTASARPGS
jgi:hypothetical protein